MIYFYFKASGYILAKKKLLVQKSAGGVRGEVKKIAATPQTCVPWGRETANWTGTVPGTWSVGRTTVIKQEFILTLLTTMTAAKKVGQSGERKQFLGDHLTFTRFNRFSDWSF